MAELTKDTIKEALAFIGEGKRIFDIFEKAESAIAVLGQLNASVESLTAKAEKLRKEVSGLEERKTTLDVEWEQARTDIASFKSKEKDAATQSATAFSNALRKKAEDERDAIVAETTALITEKAGLVNLIVGLGSDRDGIAGDIKALKESQATEQARLDAILAKIAELKNRL